MACRSSASPPWPRDTASITPTTRDVCSLVAAVPAGMDTAVPRICCSLAYASNSDWLCAVPALAAGGRQASVRVCVCVCVCVCVDECLKATVHGPHVSTPPPQTHTHTRSSSRGGSHSPSAASHTCTPRGNSACRMAAAAGRELGATPAVFTRAVGSSS